MTRLHQSKPTRGFTLIELMVTLVVLAIFLALAVPSFRDAIHRNQVSSASNALIASFAYARSEASNRGTIVSICPSADGQSCAGGLGWEGGWLVYAYTPGNGVENTVYAAGSAINIPLRYIQARNGVSIQAIATIPAAVSFNAQGAMLPTQPTPTTLAFVTCYRDGNVGTGQSTAAVPGSRVRFDTTGQSSSAPWKVGTACTGPTFLPFP